MKAIKTISLVAALFSGCVAANQTGEYTEFVGAAGAVNWSKGKIEAEGMGAAPPNKPPHVIPLLACRAAIADAQRNLLEATKGVRVQATTVVEKYMLASDQVSTSVEGVVRNALITEKTPLADGTCRVTVTAPLAGNLSQTIYQHAFDLESQKTALYYLLDGVGKSLSWLMPAKAHAATSNQQILRRLEQLEARLLQLEQGVNQKNAPSAQSDVLPTGLIIDVRGGHFVPSMSPKIYSKSGKKLYPKKQARDAILENGRLVSLFTRDLSFAQRHPKVGERPWIIKAAQSNNSRTDIVVNEKIAAKLQQLIASQFFNDAGVIIVLD
ncbi:LPP20 family lipoprotein [Catenovulum agarivorans]|nr:hypothetical protein [Catenovulum agarivorans]